MLTGMRLENFKSWGDTGRIRLAPLTVFFGRNSSGKSSLLQALLLMKQTGESLDQRQVLNLGGNDALVDLGTYNDMVFGHETTRDVGLTFDWIVQEPRASVMPPYSQTCPTSSNNCFLGFPTSALYDHAPAARTNGAGAARQVSALVGKTR